MTRQDLTGLARIKAGEHGLPPQIVLAVCSVESAWNPWAVRYEPGFERRYLQGGVERFRPCSVDTERTMRATSWGLMQVLGQVARELGCREPYLSALCDPVLAVEYGCLALSRLKGRDLERFGWAGVVCAYNTGLPQAEAGKAYVAKIDAALADLGTPWPA
jgi:soluble lytic murein transglycosylase-like protein